MKWELWTKIVDDMREFPRRTKRINTYKDGESLLHPRYCDMIRYLRDADVAETIWTKTNGIPLSPSYNARLVSCGLDMIGISVQHVHAQGFYDIARVRIDYEAYRANVLDLFQRSRDTGVQISTKIADVGLSDADKQKFLDDFGDRCDFIAIENLHGWSASHVKDWKMGTDKSFDGTPRNKKIACPLTLYMLTVASNGSVQICNDSWMLSHNIGDVNKENLIDIWNGEKLRNFRLMHLTGNRSQNIECGTCDYIHALPDNIDNDRDEYIKRLK
jgi:radical SAM protein with 4Fe4S-binding SPASM domain